MSSNINNINNINNKKYRPYLTQDNMTYILHLVKLSTPLTAQSKQIIKVLAPYLSKIENEVAMASYTANPRETLLASLGGEDETPKEDTIAIAQLRSMAYYKWCDNPDSCSITELERAYEYRAKEGLLTTEELLREEESWNNIDMSEYTTLKEDKPNDL